METITITTKNQETYSAISNFFIDYYMTEANGEFVKVYLYLIRLLNSGRAVTVADIADHFNLTEKDICRAIRYWINENVLQLEYTKDRILTGITMLPLTAKTSNTDSSSLLSMLGVEEESVTKETVPPVAATKEPVSKNFETTTLHTIAAAPETIVSATREPFSPAAGSFTTSPAPETVTTDIDTDFTTGHPGVTVPKKVTYNAAFIEEKQADVDFADVLYQTETYFGRPLTQTDTNTLLYIYEELSFSPDLLEYLVDYCVSLGKRSCRYIESVAISWYKNGITKVKDAKEASKNYNSLYLSVLKELGIEGRMPTGEQRKLIDTWYDTYAFDKQIIIEACRRAISIRPHSANLNYVNKILANWHEHNVKKLSDIDSLDQKWEAEKKKKSTSHTAPTNQFNNYQNSTNASVVNEFENLFLQETNQ